MNELFCRKTFQLIRFFKGNFSLMDFQYYLLEQIAKRHLRLLCSNEINFRVFCSENYKPSRVKRSYGFVFAQCCQPKDEIDSVLLKIIYTTPQLSKSKFNTISLQDTITQLNHFIRERDHGSGDIVLIIQSTHVLHFSQRLAMASLLKHLAKFGFVLSMPTQEIKNMKYNHGHFWETIMAYLDHSFITPAETYNLLK